MYTPISKTIRTTRQINVEKMESTAAEKQFLVQSLKLPRELCDEINAYVFYDKHTVDVRNQFRETCTAAINNAYSNRRQGGGTSIDAAVASGTVGFRGETEDWWFAETEPIQCDHLPIRLYMSVYAVNCRFCGNYLMSNTIITNNRLKCFCNRQIGEFFELLNDWTVDFLDSMWNNAH